MSQTSSTSPTASRDSGAGKGWASYFAQTPGTTSRGSRQITRNRASYSCHACRRRKVKCDKVHPVCGQCAKIGVECLFNNTRGTDGKAASQPGGTVEVPPTNDPPRDTQGAIGSNSREGSYGQKRRRTSTIKGLQESTEITRGSSQQNGILHNTVRREGSSASSASGLGDVERRLHRLTEIVGQYVSDVTRNASANSENTPQPGTWWQGKPWSPMSSPRGSASEALGGRNTANSVSSTSKAAETHLEVSQNGSDLSTLSSSGLYGPTAKANSTGSQSTPEILNMLSHILESPTGDPSSKREMHTSQHTPGPPYPSTQHAWLGSGNPQGTGNMGNIKNLYEHDKDARPLHQADSPHGSVGDLALGHLSLEEGGRSRYISNAFWASIGSEISELSQLLRDLSQQRPPLSTEQVACPPAQRPHVGGANLTPSSGELNVSARPMTTETFCANISNPPAVGESSSQNPCLLPMKEIADKANLLRFEDPDEAPDTLSLLAMVAELPSKQQCDLLYRGFMAGVHPIVPLVHPPRFYHDYSEFWEWMEHSEDKSRWPTSILRRQPTILPLIFAVIYGGSISCSAKELSEVFGSTPKASINGKLYNATTNLLSIVSFPRTPTIASLSAFLIVQTLMIREEQPMTSCMFIGLALRVAQSMGLHRDGSLYGMEPVDAEVRRRVWWHILHMDVMTAVASGLPPLVNGEGLYDTRPISELKDEYIGTLEGIEYERAVAEGRRSPDAPDDPINGAKTSMTAVCYVMTAGRYFESTIVRKLLGRILGVKSSSRKEVEEMGAMLHELRSELDKRISRIPTRGLPEMGFTPEIDAELELPTQALAAEQVYSGLTPAGDNEWQLRCDEKKLIAFHAWSRILLSLLEDKAFAVLYQSLLKSAKSKFWAQGRQCALRHCHSFMQKFIHLCTARVFQPFRWCYPGTYQPMHATMILLVDLYERPDSPEAPRSRSFIDEIFSLFGPDGGIVTDEDGVTIQRPLREGGREAWAMLKSLRRKAWEKAGLDPDIMWTEARQREAGYLEPLTTSEKLMRQMREGFLIKGSVGQCLANGSIATTEVPAGATPASANDTPRAYRAAPGDDASGLPGPAAATTGGNDNLSYTAAEGSVKTTTNGDPNIPCFANALAEPQLPSQTHEQPSHRLPGPNLDLSYLAPSQSTTNPQFFTHHQKTPSPLSDFTVATATATLMPPNNSIPTPTLPPNVHTDKSSTLLAQHPQPQLHPRPQPDQDPTLLGDMDADFDWDEWDTVFGKFVSLEEDLMDVDLEGVTLV